MTEADGSSWASSPTARKVMLGNKSRDTKPELAVRKLLHAAGMRYRVFYQPVKGLRRTADIAFTRQKVAVFIDGCFWHSCPVHGRSTSKTNAEYWSAKLAANRLRDLDTNERLERDGWTVLRFWEHEVPTNVAAAIRDAVLRAGE